MADTNTTKNEGKINVFGNADNSVSPYLKAWISQPDSQKNITSCVVGLIGPGTSRSLQANWNSPFEQSNVGGMFEKTGGVLQAASNLTSVTTFSSTQIWEGNRPHTFQLNLIFYALTNAKAEVHDALRELEMMMGPAIEKGAESDLKDGFMTWASETLKSVKPGGRIPAPVILNIGRRMIIPDCVIESMAVPLDKEKTAEGYLVRAEVNLSISTKVMLNKENIANTY